MQNWWRCDSHYENGLAFKKVEIGARVEFPNNLEEQVGILKIDGCNGPITATHYSRSRRVEITNCGHSLKPEDYGKILETEQSVIGGNFPGELKELIAPIFLQAQLECRTHPERLLTYQPTL